MVRKRTRYMLNDVETAKTYLANFSSINSNTQMKNGDEDSSETLLEGEVVPDLSSFVPHLKGVIKMMNGNKLEYSKEQEEQLDGQLKAVLSEAAHMKWVVNINNFFEKAPFLKELLNHFIADILLQLIQRSPDLGKMIGGFLGGNKTV
jgi:hypothetical protein